MLSIMSGIAVVAVAELANTCIRCSFFQSEPDTKPLNSFSQKLIIIIN